MCLQNIFQGAENEMNVSKLVHFKKPFLSLNNSCHVKISTSTGFVVPIEINASLMLPTHEIKQDNNNLWWEKRE